MHHVGVQTADGHQAAQVAALVIGLVVLVHAHLGRRPTLQVTRAVDGAEALPVCCYDKIIRVLTSIKSTAFVVKLEE